MYFFEETVINLIFYVFLSNIKLSLRTFIILRSNCFRSIYSTWV